MTPTAERFQCELDELEFERDELEFERDEFTGGLSLASEFDESKIERDEKGQFVDSSSHPGAAHGSSVSIKSVSSKRRVFSGEPVATQTTLTKQETGRVGEAVCVAWLRANVAPDARAMNSVQTNFPVDLIEDHAPTEVKAGLVSNSTGAQKWRLTFSKESAKEKALYAKMSPRQRASWNTKKQSRIKERKEAVLKKLGKNAKPRTMCVIVNPDTQTADVYVFEGWHDVIRWNGDAAKAAYKGTVKYDHS